METPIEVDVKGFGKFVGWQLEDDKRFLLGDFTVSHNSPEGAAVGIVKNLAMTVSITNKVNSLKVKDIIVKTPGYSYVNNFKLKDSFIFVNGELFGYITLDLIDFVEKLKSLRDANIIHPHTSIVFNGFEE